MSSDEEKQDKEEIKEGEEPTTAAAPAVGKENKEEEAHTPRNSGKRRHLGKKQVHEHTPKAKKPTKTKVKKKVAKGTKNKKFTGETLAFTSVSQSARDIIITAVKHLGRFQISEEVTESTTHVICGGKRTLKTLDAIAQGAWLLSPDWASHSISAEHWVPEEKFELVDKFPAAKTARQERNKDESGTFLATTRVFVPPGLRSPPRNRVLKLLRACGGKIAESVDNAEVVLSSSTKRSATEDHKKTVQPKWLFDCITSHKKLPVKGYAASV